MPGLYFDPLFLVFALPAMLIGLIASAIIKLQYSKYSNIANVNSITGAEVVERIARAQGLNISMQVSPDHLSDNYNPGNKVVTLSHDIAYGKTIAAAAIAAHEMGHAMQHHQKSALLSLRSFIVPAVNLGSTFGYILFVAGVLLSFAQLAWVGVLLFSATTIFTLVTLPVEIDASKKAMSELKAQGILFDDELAGARSVLTAAGLTYVAATLQSLANLAYFVTRASSLSRD